MENGSLLNILTSLGAQTRITAPWCQKSVSIYARMLLGKYTLPWICWRHHSVQQSRLHIRRGDQKACLWQPGQRLNLCFSAMDLTLHFFLFDSTPVHFVHIFKHPGWTMFNTVDVKRRCQLSSCSHSLGNAVLMKAIALSKWIQQQCGECAEMATSFTYLRNIQHTPSFNLQQADWKRPTGPFPYPLAYLPAKI